MSPAVLREDQEAHRRRCNCARRQAASRPGLDQLARVRQGVESTCRLDVGREPDDHGEQSDRRRALGVGTHDPAKCWRASACRRISRRQTTTRASSSSTESSTTRDFYFVSNQTNQVKNGDFLFRIHDRMPELWDPVTGVRRDLPNWSIANDGRTRIPMTVRAVSELLRRVPQAGRRP